MWNFTLYGAYLALGIHNGDSLADEDVGVAYYKERPLKVEYSTNALEFIAEARRSRFLRFLATIGEHLNEKNIAILANKTFPASPEPENSGEVFDATGLVGKMTEAPTEPENIDEESIGAKAAEDGSANDECSQNHGRGSPESEMEVDAFGEHYSTSSNIPSKPRIPSTPEASISSSDGASADSDLSEEVGGMFFSQHSWHCEECCSVLVNGKCPDGHELRRCKNCGWQLDSGPCQRCPGTCDACGGESVDGQCNNCGAGEESEDDDTIAFDEGDKIWRCVSCMWEVEADNESDGNCHCLNDKGETHSIDLSGYHDYEPADSCSSEDDSTDSESNSDDERLIDDTEVSIDGIPADTTTEPVNLAALYPAREIENILKATAKAKGAKNIENKENLGSIASSDDIEIIDAPTANVLPILPDNIIDCESMDI